MFIRNMEKEKRFVLYLIIILIIYLIIYNNIFFFKSVHFHSDDANKIALFSM